MEIRRQKVLAEEFRKKHLTSSLILPNCWNGGSARIFEKSGFEAVATTSAGIAYSMGYSDGEVVDFDDILRITREICQVIKIPLSVDLERGYATDSDIVLSNIQKIIRQGAVGINIEDGDPETGQVDELKTFSRKISSISELRDSGEIPFFLNARTDIFLLRTASEEKMIDMTIERAQALKESGADCIFIPGVLSWETIVKLRSAIELPINLFVYRGMAELKRLSGAGINRISSGSAFSRTVNHHLISHAVKLKEGRIDTLLDHEFNYSLANEYFK